MDKLNEIIDKLEKKIKEYFKHDTSGHNIDHLKRTLNNALYLQSKEGGDRIVIGVAAYIHDIHRIMSGKGRFISPAESIPVVREFINDLDITEEQRKHICMAIEHHEEYNFSSDCVKVSDIESLILQDADNLDAIGAIGIGRTFAYGVTHNIPFYDDSIFLYQNDYREDGDDDPTTIHHINNKLLRLGENMNTLTAKEIAKDRTHFTMEFMKRYINEWCGKF